LPDLIRQSMRKRGLKGLADEFFAAAHQHGPPDQVRW
jgi:hypothetical protein